MITAETSIEMVMGALEYQPDSYLTKPYTKSELMNRVDRAVARKIEYKDIESVFERNLFAEAISLCDKKLLEILIRQCEQCESKVNAF